jgi:hypothetical protein
LGCSSFDYMARRVAMTMDQKNLASLISRQILFVSKTSFRSIES